MLSRLKQLTQKKDRNSLVFLFLVLLIATAVEMIGIGSIPIFAMVIIEPEVILKHLPSIINIDFVIHLDKKELALYSSIALLIIFFFKNSFLGFVNYFQGQIIRRIRTSIYNNLFFLYIHSKYEFHLSRNPSELIRNVTSEVSKTVYYIMSSIMLVKESLIMIMIFVMLVIIDPKISLLTFSLLAIFSLLFFFISRKGTKRRGKIVQEFMGKLIKTISHGLGSIKETKILNKENYILNSFKSHVDTIERHNFYQNFIVTLPRLFLEFIAVITVVVVSVLFVLLDRPFQTFIPLITLITVSAVRLIPCFNIVSSSIATIRYQSASFKLISKEINNLKNKIPSEKIAVNDREEKKINTFKKSLEIKDLVYYYPGTNKKAIDNVSFKINYGDVLGVIGISGAGKSTLIDLIVGLLDPSEGKILVDGTNIKESKKEWQKQIGYIPQEIYLLDDTIKSNIAFGIPEDELNEEYLFNAIRLSQLEIFINSLPKKENTIIGDRGIRLSGGQRQRIGIARSLYFKPKILIFDEPTSSLDIYNEKKIMKDLYSLGGNLTIVIISHRYTIFEGCKKILNLQNGKIDAVIDYEDFLNKKDSLNI